MTWREIRDSLNQMPDHLLDAEASLWIYNVGGIDIIPVHSMVSPLSEGEDPNDSEWGEGGNYSISLQFYND